MFLLHPKSCWFCISEYIIYIPLCFYYIHNIDTINSLTHKFTFHYVSITSKTNKSYLIAVKFIYIPLCFYYIDYQQGKVLRNIGNLHSTMFLLHQKSMLRFCTWKRYLHSTMFLLHLYWPLRVVPRFVTFTFHYVSITSVEDLEQKKLERDLHSTMFLLHRWKIFKKNFRITNLHSTMFLLHLPNEEMTICINRIYIPLCFYYIQVTGHKPLTPVNTFTFHYVSITS